jgi:hypothetical protein
MIENINTLEGKLISNNNIWTHFKNNKDRFEHGNKKTIYIKMGATGYGGRT